MLVDTHCHLAYDELRNDLAGVLGRAEAAGVGRCVVIGTDVPSTCDALALAESDRRLFAAAGIHPNDCEGFRDWASLEDLARRPRVVALGETGLDWYRTTASREAQREAFARTMDIANALKKPVVIHCREAYDDTLDMIASARPAGVMHCFAGDEKHARRALDLGFYISFAGPVTYKKSEPLRKIASWVPRDRILVETDAPFLPPEPHRGKRNEPAFARLTAECVAKCQGLAFEDFARQESENAARLFGWKD
ncbi:MAG: TatD family hydrolase [Planctomycetia bacterium]|nr:TatD family hydrolase [Planctomycetia bacterium]